MSEAPLISIIDDDALARDGIGELVESLGYKVVAFKSAKHFLESGLIAKTTCLITDLQMPGLNGLELHEELRSQGYQTPIILITAYPNEKHRKRALDNGAVGFLCKPFDDEALIECLTTAIGPAGKREIISSLTDITSDIIGSDWRISRMVASPASRLERSPCSRICAPALNLFSCAQCS